MDSFLTIAEEIKLKGLTGQTSSDVLDEQKKSGHSEPAMMDRDLLTRSTNDKRKTTTLDVDTSGKFSKDLVVQDQYGTNLQALDEKVKSMMEKGQKMIPNGKQANGTPKQSISFICKVCGKEGRWNVIRDHIESNHLEGVSIPCDYCGMICPTRQSLTMHTSRFHK